MTPVFELVSNMLCKAYRFKIAEIWRWYDFEIEISGFIDHGSVLYG